MRQRWLAGGLRRRQAQRLGLLQLGLLLLELLQLLVLRFELLLLVVAVSHGGQGSGAGRRGRIAEALVLGQRGDRAERLAALGALDLHATVAVHALVAAQVRELRVRLQADLALERLDGRVDVRVLLKARRGGERFTALRTGVTASTDVMRANVPL